MAREKNQNKMINGELGTSRVGAVLVTARKQTKHRKSKDETRI